jgi:hypothetical protein
MSLTAVHGLRRRCPHLIADRSARSVWKDADFIVLSGESPATNRAGIATVPAGF